MSIVFMGTPDFAVPVLEQLYGDLFNIKAVVTQPDKQRGRGRKVSYSPVKEKALEYNIEVLQPEKMRDKNFIERLKEIKPDLFVVVAFRILPKSVLSIPKLGSINLHTSLLPDYRGAAPINHALFNGEKRSGVSVFFLNSGEIDSGEIIDQLEISINDDDNYGTLYNRMSVLGAIFLRETIEKIVKGDYSTRPQTSCSKKLAPKIFNEDMIIDWSRSSVDIHNQIRGLSPKPSAYTYLKGKVFKIIKSALVEGSSYSGDIGSLVELDKKKRKFYIKTGDGVLALLEVQPSGKKVMDIGSFLNGTKISIGEILGEDNG
ncbi:MAG: methionyl-tRNA formyltransferase [Candidatus Cloacimonadota bacterium]|nr:MAG: methionyl-tRNA formyltransferase [Candidatus Cloacimonadota bacterium]PIE78138.1 MAG: methionyl-tRNA formyltransferase [Candidatus Delongbacteria bacterium]